MRLFKDEWYEIGDRIVRVAREITIELSPNIQEIRVYPTLIQSNKLIQGQTDTCIITFCGNPSDITPINFWDLGSKIPWSVFQQLIMRYYTHEEILLEAKRRFPIGTKYYPAHISKASFIEPDANFIVGQDQSFILDHHSLSVDLYNPDNRYYSKDRNGHAYNQVLFHQGDWARILSKPNNNQSMTRQERLLAEAISKYPIGTKYIPLTTSGKAYPAEDIAEVVKTPNGDSDYIEGGHGFLYVRGKWAEIFDKNAILAKAREEFPVGTKYKPISSSGNLYDSTMVVTRTPAWHSYSENIEGGPGYIYYQGKWAEIVASAGNSIDYDAILAEAIRRYPIGTDYYPLDSGANKSQRIITSVKEAVWFEKKVNNFSRNPQDLIEIGNGYVYVDGKWAEIAENNIDYDAVLEIAKRKYPIGTKYMPLSGEGNLYTSAKISHKEAHWYNKKSNGHVRDKIEIGYGFAYVNGKWAEVIEEASPKNSFPSEAEVLRRYPKGTWYLPIFRGNAVGESPKQSKGIYRGGNDYLWVNDEMGTGYVYDGRNQKWADVVPNPNSVEVSMAEYPVTTQDAYFPTEKLVARKEVLTKQSASQHKVEELPLLKIKKF